MRILYTKDEGGLWTPLYLRNIDSKGLFILLTEGVGDIDIARNKRHTILSGMITSSIIEPKVRLEKDVEFHSLMFSSGLIFDSTLHAIEKNDGLDYQFFEVRNFGLSAKRFEELWKSQSANARDLWVGEEGKKARIVRMRKNRMRRKRKKNNE